MLRFNIRRYLPNNQKQKRLPTTIHISDSFKNKTTFGTSQTLGDVN